MEIRNVGKFKDGCYYHCSDSLSKCLFKKVGFNLDFPMKS